MSEQNYTPLSGELQRRQGISNTLQGNNNAMKYDTPEKRQALCDAYCRHLEQGFSKDCFIECDIKTIKRYIRDFPSDFPPDKIERAEKANRFFWEKIGLNGVMGIPTPYKDKEGKTKYARFFNDRAWVFNMKNRFGWTDRQETTVQGGDKPIQIAPAKIEYVKPIPLPIAGESEPSEPTGDSLQSDTETG